MAKRARTERSLASSGGVPEAATDAFISHSSLDKPLATRLEQSLQGAHIRVWIDHANLRAGGLLLDALQDALVRSANLVLLWSGRARESLYVSAEWQAAWHLQKGIIPCLLDETPLPPFLLRYLYCDFRQDYEAGVSRLTQALAGTPEEESRPPVFAAPAPLSPQAPAETVEALSSGQNRVLARLGANDPAAASGLQAALDPEIESAVRSYPEDATILDLAGYQKKNAYLIRHWEAIQARQSPADGLLTEAERLFHEALSIRPDDPSALNGLSSVLLLRQELDAAEFFARRALARARQEGLPYAEAEHDLKLIRRLKRRPAGA